MKALAEFMGHLGTSGSDAKRGEVKQVFRTTHRTIQQCFMREVLLPILEQLSEGGSDLRNKASVEMAKKMLAAVGDDKYLPYI